MPSGAVAATAWYPIRTGVAWPMDAGEARPLSQRPIRWALLLNGGHLEHGLGDSLADPGGLGSRKHLHNATMDAL